MRTLAVIVTLTLTQGLFASEVELTEEERREVKERIERRIEEDAEFRALMLLRCADEVSREDSAIKDFCTKEGGQDETK